jgi:hypothetical protein
VTAQIFSGHDTDRLIGFTSTNEIIDFFAGHNTPVTSYPLALHTDQYFWLAAYPYSGLDTIDLYCFVHHGPRQWRIQMVYFALSPKTRNLTVVEGETRMVVKDGDEELVTVSVNGTKIAECVENLFAIGMSKTIWADKNHKAPNDTPKLSDLKDELERQGITNGVPICPQGGSYVLGRVKDLPRCTKGGRDHSLPVR